MTQVKSRYHLEDFSLFRVINLRSQGSLISRI